MSQSDFIGIGHNPEGPDLPLGLGMRLAQDPEAMNAFGRMTVEQKRSMIAYIQGTATGGEAEERMNDALNRLRENKIEF